MEYGEEKKTYGVLLPVLLVVALLIGYFYLKPGSSRKVSPENGGELVLHTAPLQPQDVTVEKTYIGYVTPINDVDVIPYISGFLEDVYVAPGRCPKPKSTTPRHLICRPRRSWPPPKPTMSWQKSTMTIRLFRRPYRGLSATFR